MRQEPYFGILILNRNGKRWLEELLSDLRCDGYRRKRVYLVDNASSDTSIEFVTLHYPEVVIIRMTSNLGYSAAYNHALDLAWADGCDWVVLQNNDTRVARGWLGSLASSAAIDDRIGVMGPVFEDWEKSGPSSYMKARHPELVNFMGDIAHEPQDTDWVEGSALALRRECADSVGPLDPNLFMYWEEVDFCRRARYQGWRVVVVPGSVVRHFGGGTASHAFSGSRLSKLKERNQYVYTLCDPNRHLLLNGLRALHLLLVNLKAALPAPAPFGRVAHHLAVFVWFIRGLGTWSKKWAFDRKQAKPPKEIACLEAKMAAYLAGRHANPLSWP